MTIIMKRYEHGLIKYRIYYIRLVGTFKWCMIASFIKYIGLCILSSAVYMNDWFIVAFLRVNSLWVFFYLLFINNPNQIDELSYL